MTDPFLVLSAAGVVSSLAFGFTAMFHKADAAAFREALSEAERELRAERRCVIALEAENMEWARIEIERRRHLRLIGDAGRATQRAKRVRAVQ